MLRSFLPLFLLVVFSVSIPFYEPRELLCNIAGNVILKMNLFPALLFSLDCNWKRGNLLDLLCYDTKMGLCIVCLRFYGPRTVAVDEEEANWTSTSTMYSGKESHSVLGD